MTKGKDIVRALHGRLAAAGFPKAYVRKMILPDWWSDEIAENPAGLAELHILIAKHLGFRYADLTSGGPLALPETPGVRLKKRVGTEDSELALAKTLASQVARFAALATGTPFRGIPASGLDVRRAILASGQSCVSFEVLLEYCWGLGIPVVHFSEMPPNARKMNGLAGWSEGRPVIVLCSKRGHSAWQLFDLAHELGHILRRHVGDGEMLVDEEIDTRASDREEQEANQSAEHIICGTAPIADWRGKWPNAKTLAAFFENEGARIQVDPGHLVLRFAFTKDRFVGGEPFKLANGALKMIETDDAMETLKAFGRRHLNFSLLPDESAVYLSKMTGVDLPIEDSSQYAAPAP